MRSTLSLMLCLSLALAGCKAKEVADKADISKDLKERGTTELMEEVAKDEYNPPADGRLTENQIQMYLKVREHEKKIAQVAKDEMKQHAEKAEKKGEGSITGMLDGFKALGSAADFMTADIRAAKVMGVQDSIPDQAVTLGTLPAFGGSFEGHPYETFFTEEKEAMRQAGYYVTTVNASGRDGEVRETRKCD